MRSSKSATPAARLAATYAAAKAAPARSPPPGARQGRSRCGSTASPRARHRSRGKARHSRGRRRSARGPACIGSPLAVTMQLPRSSSRSARSAGVAARNAVRSATIVVAVLPPPQARLAAMRRSNRRMVELVVGERASEHLFGGALAESHRVAQRGFHPRRIAEGGNGVMRARRRPCRYLSAPCSPSRAAEDPDIVEQAAVAGDFGRRPARRRAFGAPVRSRRAPRSAGSPARCRPRPGSWRAATGRRRGWSGCEARPALRGRARTGAGRVAGRPGPFSSPSAINSLRERLVVASAPSSPAGRRCGWPFPPRRPW